MPGDGAQQVFVREDGAAGGLLTCPGGHAYVHTARAPGKETPNEDAAAVIPLGESGVLLAVADGLGGRPAGESAAEMVVRALCAQLAAPEASRADGTVVRRAVLDAIEQTNRGLLELGVGAATTLAAVEIVTGVLRPYHVGDSAIVVVGQKGRVKLQTVAHSPVGYAVESGLLAEEEAIHHEERHLISNMVGAADMRIELGSQLSLAPRDTVVLATDGLLDNLHPREIVDRARVKPLPEAAGRLASLAEERMRAPKAGAPFKPDDLTFVLFRLGTAAGI